MASTTLPEPTDKTPEPTRDEVVQAEREAMLDAIATAVTSGLPAPLSIDLHRYDRHEKVRLQLRMDNNKPDQVDAWATVAGSEAAFRDAVFETGGKPWRQYIAGGIGAGVSWRGWEFEVWSAVDEPEESAS